MCDQVLNIYFRGALSCLSFRVAVGQCRCGNTQNECEIVVQYMCADTVRDGVTTRTIPETPTQCANNDCSHDARFGMNEDYDYYMNCQ
jgi:hypothetical protein